jgi:hypothetical protein
MAQTGYSTPETSAALAPATDALAVLSDPRLHRFHAYLEAKRGTREFAARRDIDPLDFAYILGNVLLLDVLYEPFRFRYRLIGTILSAKAGYDLTGKFVDDHPDRDYSRYVTARYVETVTGRRPTSGNYEFVMDGKVKRYQCLRVPLSSDGRTIDMLVAAVITGPKAPPLR